MSCFQDIPKNPYMNKQRAPLLGDTKYSEQFIGYFLLPKKMSAVKLHILHFTDDSFIEHLKHM